MTTLAERLDLPEDRIEKIAILGGHALPDPDVLFAATWKTAPQDPDTAQVLLAAAILSCSGKTAEGRLSAAQALLAPLVANANPAKTLGPDGAKLREDLLCSQWEATIRSWKRLRHAWREGLSELLDPAPEKRAIANALDEVTRLNPAEPEPVAVAIQEQFPPPRVGFVLSALGIGLMIRSAAKDMRPSRRK